MKRTKDPSGVEKKRSPLSWLPELKKKRVIRQAMLALPEWITPNAITGFRLLMALPVFILLETGYYWWALGVFIVSMLLDFADGARAEALEMNTEVGAFLDPLADKIAILSALWAIAHLLPAWSGVLLLYSLALLEAGLIWVRIEKMLTKEENSNCSADIRARQVGKHKMVTQVVGLSIAILGLALDAGWLLWIAATILMASVLLAVASLYNHSAPRD